MVDIGNSNIVMGWYQEERLVKKWRIQTRKEAGQDEYSFLFQGLIGQELLASCKAALIGSVVPELTWIVKSSLSELLGLEPIVISNELDLTMPLLIDNPAELGVDRLINSFAAFEKWQQASIVIDFGTATTFDCVSPKGEYLGGAIAPGLHISLQALVEKTSKLPHIELRPPEQVIGKNTLDAMRSGLLYGHAAFCDGMVEKIAAEIGGPLLVIATGGLAKLMHRLSKKIQHIDEDLTIWGMMRVYSKFFSH